ncbi:cellulose biosynthesis cyclic di-GMP-binding regulatory protein BcsB [Methylomusa anaerophila]|uniref:Cellulose synthase regulator protein n=1 Tax=Methylomusa anaerophila TaxID=1930071 RepID=A0A348AR22_9FIRM|nr:cellulose biosynthesis cyclic di-GMP-binding regulatory protein BcsB [Methylomusa anaerophila]BBB93520.1 cellulose synthase regulator protein [Methylomusa anaerophila]
MTNKMIKIVCSMFSLLLLLLILSFGQSAKAAPSASGDSYTLRLFNVNTVLRNPNDSISGYFDIYQGSAITEPAVLDLWYSYSPTTKTELSFITISVNGVPVDSRPLEPAQAAMVNWLVALPANQIKTGFNEVNISVVHRSIDGLCRDIDNEANWFIIRPETRISFKVARSPYSLASYPMPFLDEYLASKVNTVFYLPDNSDQVMLASLFNLATNWGARGLTGVPQRMEVRLGQPGQVPANEVVLGLTSQWQGNQNKTAVLTLAGLSDGFNRLLITGDDTSSMAKAMDALSRPQLVKTFLGQQTALSTNLPADKQGTVKKENGVYTLVDLGYQQDIAVAGAFHQEAVINVPRPSNYKAGDGSYIELHFHHAKILDPKKSAVTIYINDVPIRSAALLAENAEKGILKAPIPVSELNKPSWRVRFGFYHDIGVIDCSKRYDEVAWSVVEKDTSIVLEKGNIERIPSLEDFPNNFYISPDGIINLTMVLPDNPSQEELSAAFKLAYYIGQQNKSKILWQVHTSSSYDASKAPGTVIALGRNDAAKQWNALKKYLLVSPEPDGGYHVADWLEVMPAALNSFDIYQIGKIDNDKLLYAFMYSSPERMNNLLNFSLLNENVLSGKLTLVDAQGNHASFAQSPAAAGTGSLAWLKSLWSYTDGVGQTYLAVFVAVLLATGALMFFMRKRS